MNTSKSKKLTVAALALLVGLIVLAWVLGAFNREPLHKGKPISYWVDLACRGYDANNVWTNRQEVKDIGPAAIPYLVRQLQATERWNDFRKRLPASLQNRFPTNPPAREMHYGAARTLALFGADAKPAAHDLTRLLPELKEPALQVLAAIGPDAKMALPALHSMLATNSDVNSRVGIANALWRIGRETNVVLDICTNALLSGKDVYNAPNVLCAMKTAAVPAVPYALSVLQNTNRSSGIRGNNAIFLGIARVDTPEIRAALIAGTAPGLDSNLRANCAMALWNYDPQYAELATRLVMDELVADRKQFPSNEQNFAMWLEYRDIDPRGALPTLKELAENGSSDEIRKEAAGQIKKIEARPGAKAK